MNNILPIFQFLKEKSDAGLKTALITLTAVTGASTRNPGAHMGVAEDGTSVGSFSGGCIETAVVAEALKAIADQNPHEVRFGAGSPYLDIRLPCDGGIDLLFSPIIDASLAGEIFNIIAGRMPVTIMLNSEDCAIKFEQEEARKPVFQEAASIYVNHIPSAKIIILGHGASVNNLAALTASYGADCEVFSPDPAIVEQANSTSCTAHLLKTPSATSLFQPDPWTACIFYFHDHDWEAQLMKQALASPAFFVGAMGSFRTHDRRKELLREISVNEKDIDRMVAPIGLIPSTRDPATLALSTLAQVVEQYHRHFQRHRNIGSANR